MYFLILKPTYFMTKIDWRPFTLPNSHFYKFLKFCLFLLTVLNTLMSPLLGIAINWRFMVAVEWNLSCEQSPVLI